MVFILLTGIGLTAKYSAALRIIIFYRRGKRAPSYKKNEGKIRFLASKIDLKIFYILFPIKLYFCGANVALMKYSEYYGKNKIWYDDDRRPR